jgi:hypothetical protein
VHAPELGDVGPKALDLVLHALDGAAGGAAGNDDDGHHRDDRERSAHAARP